MVTPSYLPFFVCGHVLFFEMAERPNFIALNPLAVEISEMFVLIFRTGFADFAEQLDDRVFYHIADAGRRSN
jgi:hypothetical protein